MPLSRAALSASVAIAARQANLMTGVSLAAPPDIDQAKLTGIEEPTLYPVSMIPEGTNMISNAPLELCASVLTTGSCTGIFGLQKSRQ